MSTNHVINVTSCSYLLTVVFFVCMKDTFVCSDVSETVRLCMFSQPETESHCYVS